MTIPKTQAWRFEFRTDMTNASAPVIPLAYLVAVQCDDRPYFGLLFRDNLTAAELHRVNLDTWPELRELKTFLPGSLGEVFKTSPEPITVLQQRHSVASALQLRQAPTPVGLSRALSELRTCQEVGAVLEGVVRKAFEKKLAATMPPVHRGKAAVKAAPARSRTSWVIESNHPQLAHAGF